MRIVRISLAGTYLDRLGGAAEGLGRVVNGGRTGRNVAPAIRALFLLGIDAWLTGQWPRARRLAQESLDLCEQHDYPILASPSQFLLGTAAAACGEYETARALSDQIAHWAGPRGADAVRLYAAHIRALSALGRGEFEEAYQQAAMIAPAGSLPPFVPDALWAVMDVVDAAVRSGRRAEAAEHVAAARAAGMDALSPRLRLLLHGSAALAAEDDDEARREFDEAIGVEGAERWPFSLGRIRLYYGECLRRGRSPGAARLQLAAAAEDFARLGAVPWAARADQELRACGGVIGRALVRPEGAVLTPQQWEIASLAAAGLTNKQIGEKLFLSPRTVSSHLYQLFPKLGITSRAALRDALERFSS
jgi:DNA-binding CsgD family transcriptional regulator